METILSPAQLWPGGVPSTVRLHPDSGLDDYHPEEEIKGWCQFLRESRTPLSDPEEDRAQRRYLIEKWACADQSFRDSKLFVCLVDKPYDPENYSRITKLLILLYIHLARTSNHPFRFDNTSKPQIPAFILDPTMVEQYKRRLNPENLPMSYYLENADFSAMAMTRTGTVIFPYLISYAFFVIDNQSCQDGLVHMLNFSSNGQIMQEARMRPWQIGRLTMLHSSLGHQWDELFDRPETSPRWNQPRKHDNSIDLQLPILEIMAVLSQRGDVPPLNDYTSAEWAEDFERFAPEFLAYEREGRVSDYGWDRLMDVTYADYSHIRHARQLAAALGRSM
ncbi:hypothetical protein N7490_010970 [Penicillium lividum]|nr:hypothetical protein N7490_010970 [Penicillium lividum]